MRRTGAVRLETHEGAAREQADADIAEAIGRGDHRAAIEVCARRYSKAIGELCMSLLGSQADAEDTAQQTLVEAYRGLGTWRAEGSIRPWLFRIARRLCARQLERRGRHRAKLRLVRESGGDADAEGLVLLRQRAGKARAALGELRPSERDALVLRYSAGLSFREIAATFGIEEAAARKRVSRGVAALRDLLEEEGQDR